MFCFDANCVEAFGARAVNVLQIKRQRIRIGDSETNTMDGLIPVTRPIREDKSRTRFEAMEVDVIGPPPGEESDSEGERECTALYASGRGGPCYYCAKEGHFLRNCPRKAAGLPISAPLSRTRGATAMRGGGRTNRRPDRSGEKAATRRSGVRRRHRRRGTGGSRGGTSPGERAGQGGTSGEGPPKPWKKKTG